MIHQINPKYISLKPFIEDIETHFHNSTQVLYDQRNVIRIVDLNNQPYVVKAFRQPNFINRFAYRYLRHSKAKRSYLYSLRLGEALTPEPIAYIERVKHGLLTKSYYISELFKYDHTIHQVLTNNSITNREKILIDFAAFTFHLHENNILHHDYSHGNILIKANSDDKLENVFKIIDINRMEFKSLNLKTRLMNFSRINANDDDMKIIIKQYASMMDLQEESLLSDALFYRDDFYQKRALKNKLRGKTGKKVGGAKK